jgi:hypothetical protein
MISPPSPADALGYIESLMQVGQDAMKQFDDAFASAAGADWGITLIEAPALPISLIAKKNVLPQILVNRLGEPEEIAPLQRNSGLGSRGCLASALRRSHLARTEQAATG